MGLLVVFGLELKGVPVDMLVRLIPEHARKQCAFLGLWFGSPKVEACSLQVAALHKYLICCRDVASGLYQVKIWKSCAICFVTLHLFRLLIFLAFIFLSFFVCRKQMEKSLLNIHTIIQWICWPDCNVNWKPYVVFLPRIYWTNIMIELNVPESALRLSLKTFFMLINNALYIHLEIDAKYWH